MNKLPLGGEIVLADKSAISRAEHPSVRQEVVAAFNARQIVTCSVVTLEVMYSARDREQLEDLEATQAMLRDIPMTDSIHHAALTAVRDLAWRGPGRHRVPVADVARLTASARTPYRLIPSLASRR